MKVDSHVSPYKRIDLGARGPAPAQPETETAIAKALREAEEHAQRIEHLRIWNHLVQTARGCNPPGGHHEN